MRSNRGRDTGPEVALRRALREAGLSGYRLQWKVAGRPDIAYPGRRVAVFVNGCFWHRCPRCNLPLPKSNLEYWASKFECNVARDRRDCKALESAGWTVVVLWECEIRGNLPGAVERVRAVLENHRPRPIPESIGTIILLHYMRWPMRGELKVVELFAGVGGFRIGLEKASPKFRTVWANQWEPGRKDQFAFACYDAHFKDTGSVNVNGDINAVWEDVPDHDLLVGGFPCQDYSVASTHAKGIQGKKGALWWNIHDIIKSKRPKYILLENVDRLLRSPVSQRGRDFGIILRCLADCGYYAEWRVINAADYGLQQRRRRTFIFAYRNDLPFAMKMRGIESEAVVSKKGFFASAFPVSGMIDASKVSRFSIGEDRYKDLSDVSKEFKEHFYKSGLLRGTEVYTRETAPAYDGDRVTLGDMLVEDAGEQYDISDADLDKWVLMKGSKRLKRKREDGEIYEYTEGAIPFPDPLDRAGRTMLTSEGTKNRSSHVVCDPKTGRMRMLTSVECERLNGFPDGWTDTGMNERHRYFCMGNALVVQLVAMMGKEILKIDRLRPPD